MTAAGMLLLFLLKEVCIVSWCVSLRIHFPVGGRGKGEDGGRGREREKEEGNGKETRGKEKEGEMDGWVTSGMGGKQ